MTNNNQAYVGLLANSMKSLRIFLHNVDLITRPVATFIVEYNNNWLGLCYRTTADRTVYGIGLQYSRIGPTRLARRQRFSFILKIPPQFYQQGGLQT